MLRNIDRVTSSDRANVYVVVVRHRNMDSYASLRGNKVVG